MELFTLYYNVRTVFEMLQISMTGGIIVPQIFYYGLIGAAACLALFILQGVALSTMAKKRGIDKRWCAFVPFVSLWYIGKLAGECQFFGKKMKRAGLYTMIAQIVVSVLFTLQVSAEIYLYTVHGMPSGTTQWETPYWNNLQGFALTVYNFYTGGDVFLMLAQLAYEILLFILMMGLYKKYFPRNYMLFSFLTLFAPPARFIIVFVIRNREAVDYEAYMRARREAYMRQQQQYHPYNHQGPYGGYYNPQGNPMGGAPYGNPYAQNQNPQPTPPDDPFEEFASDKGGSAEQRNERGGNTQGGNSDDFFS